MELNHENVSQLNTYVNYYDCGTFAGISRASLRFTAHFAMGDPEKLPIKSIK